MTLDIIITNYNYARYLSEAIHSAIEQTVPPNRVIVVDDGSTDNSRDVIASFGDSIIPVLQDNAGQSAAFNSGFRRSDADLVLFLDSDDFLDRHAVERIQSEWREGAAKIHFPLQVVRMDGRPTGAIIPSSPLAEGDVTSLLLETAFYVSPPGSGNVYPRKVLEACLPLPTEKGYYADTLPAYASPFYGELIVIPEPLGFYRIHGANNNFVGPPNAKTLRSAIEEYGERVKAVKRMAAERGLQVNERRFSEEIHYLKIRVSLIRLEPQAAENENATRVGLVFRGVMAAIRDRHLPLRRKGLYIAWFLAMLVATKSAAGKLVALGGGPGARSPAMTKILN